MILYAKGTYRVYRENGRLLIKDGLYTVEGYAPCTLAEARVLVDALACCPVCGGDKTCTCHTCRGDGRQRNRVACAECLGRGYITCPRCQGTGVSPE